MPFVLNRPSHIVNFAIATSADRLKRFATKKRLVVSVKRMLSGQLAILALLAHSIYKKLIREAAASVSVSAKRLLVQLRSSSVHTSQTWKIGRPLLLSLELVVHVASSTKFRRTIKWCAPSWAISYRKMALSTSRLRSLTWATRLLPTVDSSTIRSSTFLERQVMPPQHRTSSLSEEISHSTTTENNCRRRPFLWPLVSR